MVFPLTQEILRKPSKYNIIYLILALPFRVEDPKLTGGPRPSCLSSEGPRLRTCACPGTSTLHRHALPVLSPVETTVLQTIQNFSDPDWSRRSQPKFAIFEKISRFHNYSYLFQVEHIWRNIITPLVVTLGTLLFDLPVSKICSVKSKYRCSITQKIWNIFKNRHEALCKFKIFICCLLQV